MRKRTRTVLISTALVAGCASFPVTPGLEAVDPTTGYRLQNLEKGELNTDETFVIISLSGGGMRAAALDYGVLRHLRSISLPSGGSLLDELDVLSSSSMASMVAAYYGLHGQEVFFDRFEEEVLFARMQSAYARKVMSPWQWPRLWSPRFGRSELAEEYLDRNLFHGATYADMPRLRPLVLLGATDMSLGAQFSFVQGHFDRLCASLDDVTVARAVTASLAFTGAFTPVAFPNYPSEQCGYTRPPAVDEVLAAGPQAGIRNYERARTWVSYEDEDRRWIHLLDGGVADNIGMRAVKMALVTPMAPWSIADMMARGDIRRLVILIVDARAVPDTSRDRKARAPKLTASILFSAGGPLSNYSTETIELVREYIDDLAEEHERAQSGRAPDVYFIHARLEQVEDEVMRERLLRLPTSLQLPADDVQALIEEAPGILEASPDYRRLIEDLALGDHVGEGLRPLPPPSE